jgi:hypothetical protein
MSCGAVLGMDFQKYRPKNKRKMLVKQTEVLKYILIIVRGCIQKFPDWVDKEIKKQQQ